MKQVVNSSWVELPKGSFSEAESASFSQLLEDKIQAKIDAKRFSRDDMYFVSKMHLNASKGCLDVNDKTLEKLRRICRDWDVKFNPTAISSHRKFLGPFIVAAKKLMYPVLNVFLKDVLRQQRNFNAATISLLVELCNKQSSDDDCGEKPDIE